MARSTAAERRAAIRARLSQAEEPPGTVEATTETFTEPVEEDYEDHPLPAKHHIPGPPGLPSQATQPRSRRPPNYKLHVLTALTLAVAIRITRYGTKALTG